MPSPYVLCEYDSDCAIPRCRHSPLAVALQTARQIELDGNSILFALLNRFEWICLQNQSFPALSIMWKIVVNYAQNYARS